MIEQAVLSPAPESVWRYPRPPRIEPCCLRIRVEFAGITVADSVRTYRLLETSHPPVYYIPPGDVRLNHFEPSDRNTFCEYKGAARYWSLSVGAHMSYDVAWSYPLPSRPYSALRDHLAFYPSRVDACYVGNERVQSQEGDFYGGWITSWIVGPFKGGPGTNFW